MVCRITNYNKFHWIGAICVIVSIFLVLIVPCCKESVIQHLHCLRQKPVVQSASPINTMRLQPEFGAGWIWVSGFFLTSLQSCSDTKGINMRINPTTHFFKLRSTLFEILNKKYLSLDIFKKFGVVNKKNLIILAWDLVELVKNIWWFQSSFLQTHIYIPCHANVCFLREPTRLPAWELRGGRRYEKDHPFPLNPQRYHDDREISC